MGCKNGIARKLVLTIICSLLLFGGTVTWAMEIQPQSPLSIASCNVSANSTVLGSAVHDGRLDTAWWAETAEGAAWLALDFQELVLPERIEIDLAQGAVGMLALEYSKGDYWYPVPEFRKIDLGGESYPRLSFSLPQLAAPTGAIRLVVTHVAGGRAGGIAEVKLFGTKPLLLPKVLQPQKVTVTGASEVVGFPVSNLVDGNTYTSWKSIPASNNVFVTFEFDATVKISKLVLYGDLQNYAYLAWQYYLNGSWLNLPNASMVSSELIPLSWNYCGEFEPEITTTALRLVLEASSIGNLAQGPGEIAIWGATNVANASGWQRYVSEKEDFKVTSNQGTVTVPLMLPENIQNVERVRLRLLAKPDYKPAKLLGDVQLPVGVIRVNDELLNPLSGSFTSVGVEKWQREEYLLKPESLLAGVNTISFAAHRGLGDFSFYVGEVAIELCLNDGSVYLLSPSIPSFNTNSEADESEEESLLSFEELFAQLAQHKLQCADNLAVEQVTDHRLTTSWEVEGQQTATLELKLATTAWPTHLALAFRDNRPQLLTVESFDGSEWHAVSGMDNLETSAFGPGWVLFPWVKPDRVQKLRLILRADGEPKLGGICEVALFGDKENTGPPKITILAPEQGAEVKRDVQVRGLLDNPDCQVLVAGVPATIDGNAFQAQVRLHPDPIPAKRINAVAIDSSMQIGSDSVVVYLNHKAPVMTVTSPVDGLMTAEDTVTVEGELGDNSITVLINGVPTRPKGRRFTYNYPLSQGLNRIVILGEDTNGAVIKVVRTVWYDDLPPYVNLDFPSSGALLKALPDRVCGRVSDFTPVTVTVNGAPATVSAGEFYLDGFSAHWGENSISIVATDALGHTTTLHSSFVCDNVSPQLTVSTPVAGTLFSTSPIIITGIVSDDLPVQVFINNYPAVIAENSFSCHYPLKEGSNILTVTAQDAAGNQTVVIFEVLLDSTPPYSFVPVISPSNWTSTMPVVSFETNDATSGISYYELAIDDGDFVVASSPYQLPLLPDGEHTIRVRAVDFAGWLTVGEAKAYIDTTPPQSFSPSTDPSGCTNNPEPLLLFEAEDDTSGIAYYTLRVNSGEPIRVTSPHRLVPLADGEYVLVVTAVDFAGCATSAEVNIIIDTAPPPAPEIVRVIPGPDNINIKWSASVDAHVTWYHVERSPAWEQGMRIVDALEIVDTDLLADEVYSYRIFALDRAANISSGTQWHEGQLGIAKGEYLPEQGAIVEFENVALIVPKDALPEGYQEIQICQIESEDLTEKAVFPIFSPIYQFSALKEGETEPEHAVAFEQGFIAKLSYDPQDLPPDFDPRNLGVYYFDTMFGKWFRVPEAGVDVENNCVLFMTNHFTNFSLQPVLVKDLSPHEYKDMGRSPLKSYVEYGELLVSPQGGTASVNVTELVLPGHAGFDFVLGRHYDTNAARLDGLSFPFNIKKAFGLSEGVSESNIWQEIEKFKELGSGIGQWIEIAESYLQQLSDYAYSMGQGWRLNIPYIRSDSTAPWVRLANGTMFSVYEMELIEIEYETLANERKMVFEQHEGADFTLVIQQINDPLSFKKKTMNGTGDYVWSSSWRAIGYELYLKDGTKYYLDGLGRTTKMVDATGKNEINFSYKPSLLLDRITDSMGRVLKFEYDLNLYWPRISKISLENDPEAKEITYFTDTLLSRLLSSRDIGGRRSTYEYGDHVLVSAHAGATVNLVSFGLNFIAGHLVGVAEAVLGPTLELFANVTIEWIQLLKKMQAPGQGEIELGYQRNTFLYSKTDCTKLFNFIPLTVTGHLYLEPRFYTTQVKVKEVESGIATTTNYNYEFDQSFLNQPHISKCVVDEQARRTSYYFKPVIKTRERYREITLNIFPGGPIVIPMTYLQDDVLGFNSKIEIFDKQSNRVILQTLFEDVNLKTFRPGREITLRGTQRHVREFAYDNWGNCIREFNSGGSFEDFHDDLEIHTRYSNAKAPVLNISGLEGSPFPELEINGNIYDRPLTRVVLAKTPVGASGVPATHLTETHYQYNYVGQLLEDATWDENKWLRNKYAYDPEYGSIISHKRADDSEVWYDYDQHGYLAKTSYKQVADVEGNAEDLALEVGHEFATGLKLWEKDGRGYVTEYRYDKLGREIATIFPDEDDDLSWDPRSGSSSARANNPQETAQFDDEANSSTVIDALGNKTLLDYDSLGRLVKIIKYKQAGGGYLPHAITKVSYDAAGNVDGIEDPNGNVTRYAYDGIGNLIATIYPDNTPNETDNPQELRVWNYSANTVTLIDALGREKTQYLDALGRVIREEQYGDFAGFVGPLSSSKQYDGWGNVVQEVDPRGNIKTSLYNHLNQLVETRLPEDSFWEAGQMRLVRPTIRYGYDAVGNKIKEAYELPDSTWQELTYTYDQLGRLIKTQVPYTDYNGNPQVAITKTYYDEANNKIKEIDPNNARLEPSQAKGTTYTYSPRGYLLTQTDPEGNTTSYTYDAVGNKTKMTDPRGYTMWYQYDDLYRVVKGILPDDTPQDLSDNPTITLECDPRGNNTKRIDSVGLETVWTYSPRNFVESVTTGGYVVSYSYDLVGNKLSETNSHQKTTFYSYDDLNRLASMRLPEGNEELYFYDQVGNKTRVLDGKGNRTDYSYNAANKLLKVTDAKGQVTRYGYDRLGNQTRTVNALGHEISNSYDELGRLLSTHDSRGYSSYGYDPVGNLITSLDPRGTESHYHYSANNLLLRVEQENQDQRQYSEYSYDEAGQRLWATDGKVSLSWAYDPVGNVIEETRNLITGDVYKMEYRYDPSGRLTKVRYPGDSSWLEYNYNPQGELLSIPGYIETAPVYDEGGYLASYTTANGITTRHRRDGNGRLVEILAQAAGSSPVLQLNYTFDAAGNVTRRNNNIYAYDELNRLSYSQVEGRFRDRLTSKNGYVTEDFLGALTPDFALSDHEVVALDYAAASLAADLGEEVGGISRLYLWNYSPSSRINAGALDLYTADSSGAYQRVEPASWQLAQSGEEYVFELREPLAGRFLKVHSKYDDRDQALNFVDQVTFRNSLGASLKIEQILAFEEREYEYDPLGNRTRESVKLLGTKTQEYSYYANSNRLLTDGQFAYVYDANGNLIRKGNSYELVGESVLFTRTTGEDVLYWEYSYDLANRLVAVNKNGVPVVSYTYDPLGLRVERVTDGQRVHYLFNLSGELIWERNLEKNEESSYIWWNGEHLAKVEGKPTDSLAVRFFYHTDLLGSPMVVTDSSGEVVWRQDYLPFGERIEQERAYAYAQTHGLTGKEYDEAIGLYYYNARWYDPELGRFITEDPARVGVNWYIYCYNNPLYFIDASGMIPTPLEAAYMAQHVHGYSDGKKYPLRGDWVARDNMLITGGDGMIMGVYSKTHPDGTLEYALVSKGSSLAFGDMWEQTKSDWKNNGQQLFGESEDVIAGIAKSIAFVRKHSGIEITFIGHSKGGAEAAANAVATNKNAILFNPMTVNLKAYQGTNKDKAEKYSASMTAFIVEGEILNKVFGPISKPIDKKVDLSQKHNTKSWYIPDALKTINSIRNHLMDAVIWGLRKDGYK